jgi:hypothetical protein
MVMADSLEVAMAYWFKTAASSFMICDLRHGKHGRRGHCPMTAPSFSVPSIVVSPNAFWGRLKTFGLFRN